MKPAILLLLGLLAVPASLAVPLLDFLSHEKEYNKQPNTKPETVVLQLLLDSLTKGNKKEPSEPKLDLSKIIQELVMDSLSNGGGNSNPGFRLDIGKPQDPAWFKVAQISLLKRLVEDHVSHNSGSKGPEPDLSAIIELMLKRNEPSSQTGHVEIITQSELEKIKEFVLLTHLRKLGLDSTHKEYEQPDWSYVIQQLLLPDVSGGKQEVKPDVAKIMHLLLVKTLSDNVHHGRSKRDVSGSVFEKPNWVDTMHLLLLHSLIDPGRSDEGVAKQADLMDIIHLLQGAGYGKKDNSHGISSEFYDLINLLQPKSDPVPNQKPEHQPDLAQLLPLLLFKDHQQNPQPVNPELEKIMELMLLNSVNAAGCHSGCASTGSNQQEWTNIMQMMTLKSLHELEQQNNGDGGSSSSSNSDPTAMMQMMLMMQMNDANKREKVNQQEDMMKFMQVMMMKDMIETHCDTGNQEPTNPAHLEMAKVFQIMMNGKNGHNELTWEDMMKMMMLQHLYSDAHMSTTTTEAPPPETTT